MSQPFRISQGGRVDHEQEVEFTFNGKRYTGLVGDTLCSALLASCLQGKSAQTCAKL